MGGPSIDAHLARVRDTSAGAVVPVVRQYLGDVHAFLSELQTSGAGGAVVNETHSDLIDRLVRRLFEFAEEDYVARGAEADTDLCVVAVGGYARRETSRLSSSSGVRNAKRLRGLLFRMQAISLHCD